MNGEGRGGGVEPPQSIKSIKRERMMCRQKSELRVGSINARDKWLGSYWTDVWLPTVDIAVVLALL